MFSLNINCTFQISLALYAHIVSELAGVHGGLKSGCDCFVLLELRMASGDSDSSLDRPQVAGE